MCFGSMLTDHFDRNANVIIEYCFTAIDVRVSMAGRMYNFAQLDTPISVSISSAPPRPRRRAIGIELN